MPKHSGAALTNQNGTRRHGLSAVSLDTETLGIESRPLRVEPVPFLCAMSEESGNENAECCAQPIDLPETLMDSTITLVSPACGHSCVGSFSDASYRRSLSDHGGGPSLSETPWRP